MSFTEQGHSRYAFSEAVPNLLEESVKAVLKRRVGWWTDGAAVYASAAQEHQADHKVTFSADPKAEEVLHWINIVIRCQDVYRWCASWPQTRSAATLFSRIYLPVQPTTHGNADRRGAALGVYDQQAASLRHLALVYILCSIHTASYVLLGYGAYHV